MLDQDSDVVRSKAQEIGGLLYIKPERYVTKIQELI